MNDMDLGGELADLSFGDVGDVSFIRIDAAGVER